MKIKIDGSHDIETIKSHYTRYGVFVPCETTKVVKGYKKLGTVYEKTHKTASDIISLVKVIFLSLLFPALCSKKYRKAIVHNWRQFLTGKEYNYSLYQLDIQKRSPVISDMDPKNNIVKEKKVLSPLENTVLDVKKIIFSQLEIKDLLAFKFVSKNTRDAVEEFVKKDLGAKIEELIYCDLLHHNTDGYSLDKWQHVTQKFKSLFIGVFNNISFKSFLNKDFKEDNCRYNRKLVDFFLNKNFKTYIDWNQYADHEFIYSNYIYLFFENPSDVEFKQAICDVILPEIGYRGLCQEFTKQFFSDLSKNKDWTDRLVSFEATTESVIKSVLLIKEEYMKNTRKKNYAKIFPEFAKKLLDSYKSIYPQSTIWTILSQDSLYRRLLSEYQ